MSWCWRDQPRWVRDQRDDSIVAMRRQGETLKAIGSRFGISSVAVLKILRKRGEAPPPKKDRLDDTAASQRLSRRIAELHPERSAG